MFQCVGKWGSRDRGGGAREYGGGGGGGWRGEKEQCTVPPMLFSCSCSGLRRVREGDCMVLIVTMRICVRHSREGRPDKFA